MVGLLQGPRTPRDMVTRDMVTSWIIEWPGQKGRVEVGVASHLSR